ncbi:MAG: chemotaxis response regulator protein-glutamate methylesterase [Verrucomicrobiota bacterium]
MIPPKKVRVLVVDDSALARRAITDALKRDPEIEVVGGAVDPYQAREMIMDLEPDVITLDLEMPRMDGLTFLKILQQHHPLPVVVVSSLTQAGSAKAMEALNAGAIDVLGKPDGSRNLNEMGHVLAHHVKAAARSKSRVRTKNQEPTTVAVTASAISAGKYSPRRIIVIGSSTGGVEALRYVLPRLPAGLPPIVVVQHIPANFSKIMAHHLDQLCPYEVREAVDGDELRSGLCLIAPGDFHLTLVPHGMGYKVRLMQSPPVHHCRPAVDILFRSAAQHAGSHAVAALLTGMGVDGAAGMKALQTAGAETLAESEESCVVFGMPQAAIKLGAANQIVPLTKMAASILEALDKNSKK